MEWIRQARESKGWSQKELAEKLFVSENTISNWELGKTFPTTKRLEQLTEILEVCFPIQISNNELQNFISSLSPTEQKKAIEILKTVFDHND